MGGSGSTPIRFFAGAQRYAGRITQPRVAPPVIRRLAATPLRPRAWGRLDDEGYASARRPDEGHSGELAGPSRDRYGPRHGIVPRALGAALPPFPTPPGPPRHGSPPWAKAAPRRRRHLPDVPRQDGARSWTRVPRTEPASVQAGVDDVASHLQPADPVRAAIVLVVFPEDVGLIAALIGSRGAAARGADARDRRDRRPARHATASRSRTTAAKFPGQPPSDALPRARAHRHALPQRSTRPSATSR